MQPNDENPFALGWTPAPDAAAAPKPDGLPAVTLTPQQLAERFVPKAQFVLRGIGDELREALGWFKWAAIAPVWLVITRAVVLRITLRASIEMAVADTAPWLLPVVEATEPLVERFVTVEATRVAFAEALSLLRTPLEKMSPVVRDAVAATPVGPVE